MSEWYRSLTRYQPGRLGRNTLLGTAGLGVRAVIQAAYLLIVSRWLGAEGYGLFAGSVALAVLGAPLANWGSSLLLTRCIAQDRSTSRAMWATALVQTGVFGSLLVLAVLAIAALLLQQRLPLAPMLLLALSELILLPAAHAATSQCHALEHGAASAVSMCLVPVGRTLAMLGAIGSGFAGTPAHAALAHFTGSALGLAAAVAVVATIDGWPAWRKRMPLRDATRQGTAYAVSNVAGTSYQDVDKVLMLQLLGAAVVGPYTVAFRVAGIFVLPVSALISATLPRLMAQHGSSDSSRTYRAVMLTALGYGFIAGVAILIFAPGIPHLFGADYRAATNYLMLLAPWPVLYALRQYLAVKLTATHRQRARSVTEVFGLILVIVLNFTLLPHLGGIASVWALLATEMAVSVAFLVTIHRSGTGTS